MRNPTFEADIFTLIYNAALQEFQYVNLDLCLVNTFQQNSYILCEDLDKDIVPVV